MSQNDQSAPLQTLSEEIANAITHGIGAALSIAALVIMLYQAAVKGTASHVVSCALFGSSLVLLYLFSTLYHAVSHKTAKKVLRRFDHIGIYLLICGTYMPLALVSLRGPLGWTVFGLQTGLCLIGVVFKAVFGPRFEFFSSLFYLLMGWLAIVVVKPLLATVSFQGFLWILLGGICYTVGIIFYSLDRKVKYFHAFWHLFVLAGSIFHFFFVLFYVIP